MPQLSKEEHRRIFRQINEAIGVDDWDTAMELMKTVPYPAEMAKIAKQVYGADYLRQTGFDFSAAEEMYGKDWLDR